MGKDNETARDRSVIILFIVIVLFICGFYCIKKNGFHDDEVVSYGLSNGHYATWFWNVDNRYDRNDLTGSIIDRDYINSYLTVDSSRTFDYRSTYMNQTNDVHPPLFYLLLHTACSFSPGVFSKWQGLSLNLVYYLTAVFLLYCCMYRLCRNKRVSALAAFMYAVSDAGISTMLFIRMYCLLMLFTVLLTYLVIRLILEDRSVFYPAIGLTVMLGMLTQYIFVFYAFSLCLVTVIYLLRCKKIKKMLLFGISALCGVFAMTGVFPYVFDQIVHGANSGTVSGNASISKMLDLGSYAHNFAESFIILFYGLMLFVFICVIVLGIKLIRIVLKKDRPLAGDGISSIKENRHIFVIIGVALILSLILLILTNPVNNMRYFYHIVPVIIILLLPVIYREADALLGMTGVKGTVSLVAAAAVLALISLLLSKPSFVYSERKDYGKILLTYEHCPAVYLTGDYFFGVSDAVLPYLMYSDDVCVLKGYRDMDTGIAKDYVESHDANDRLLVYVSTDNTDPDSVADGVLRSGKYKVSAKLFRTDRLYLYLLETE